MQAKFLLALCAFFAVAYASSHSEAPGTAANPSADVSDFYMFRCYEPGREDHTCFIMNAYPVQTPYGGPNYFTLSDDHFFEIYVDNDGDANEDITFQFFAGNNLGGDLIEVPFEADEDDCFIYQRVAAPRPLTEMKHGGLTLNIGGMDVAVPLKFLGPISNVNDANLNWEEYYRLNIIRGDRTFGTRQQVTNARNGNIEFPKPFDYAGTKTFSDYSGYARQHEWDISIPGCSGEGRVFVGQRREAFHVALGDIFDLINLIPIPGFPGAVDETNENNDLADINVTSFVLEVPTECLVGSQAERGVIGAWTGVRKLHHNGEEHVPGKQVSRLGSPLVNELVIGLRDKGKFNEQEPRMDGDFAFYVTNPTLPAIINILFRDAVNTVLGANIADLAPTNIPRNDLVIAFLTGVEGINQPINVVASEMLRLNTTIPTTSRDAQNQFGVLGGDLAGFPNGRRPGDDVVDIALRVVMGALCHANIGCAPEDAAVGNVEFTDGAPLNARDLDGTFPYMRTPFPGSTGGISSN